MCSKTNKEACASPLTVCTYSRYAMRRATYPIAGFTKDTNVTITSNMNSSVGSLR